jgi:AcrR family transcriptional regulator
MVRGFNNKEKEYIRNKLLEKGKEHFERFGLKKTNVADLASEAGIAKGSFYLFFESKEDLFLTINEEFDKQLQSEVAQAVMNSHEPKDTFRKALRKIIELCNSDPMLKLAANKEEFESMVRKVPVDQFRHHQESAEIYLAQLIKQWQEDGIIREYDPRAIVGAIKSLYYVVLHRKFIGEDIFPQVAELLIDSIVNNLVKVGR